jgi:hypothetical protein
MNAKAVTPLSVRATFALLGATLLATLAGCSQPRYVLNLSEERRIWVVRGSTGADAAVFRCADGSGPDQPPKPVCIRATMVENPE